MAKMKISVSARVADMLVQIYWYRYWHTYRSGESIGRIRIGWTHISPTLNMRMHNSERFTSTIQGGPQLKTRSDLTGKYFRWRASTTSLPWIGRGQHAVFKIQ
jgi:hypothetical protein